MRNLLLAIALVIAACRPEKVENPHVHVAPRTNPEIQQDVGGTAPDASVVQAIDGTQTDLTRHWAEQRVVLVFYMGHWCPECQKQLGSLNEHQQEFAAKHTEVIAVSTDTTADATALKAKLGLTFDLYSDPELKTIAKWGVADYGTNIAKPATFVIQKGGAVTFKRIGGTTNDRPSTEEILAQLSDQP